MIAWFQFCLLTLVLFFSESKSFSLFLSQVDKVFLGTFCFPATNILRMNTTTWKKNKQKNIYLYLASFKALNQSDISTFNSRIQKFKHFNIWTLVTMHIMKELWIKNGTMSVICNVNLMIEEDLSILLVKEYDLKTHIKAYHIYMMKEG